MELIRTDPSGAETERVVLHDGDHFGELALAEGGRRQESVRTRAASEFLMLRRDQLLELQGRIPQLRAAPAPT